MSAPLPPVTLTTDFGTSDHYAAQMKGVILGLAPGTPIVDVTHDVAPQNVRGAAWIVADLAEAFPAGTVHVSVVDPGVGSERAILAVESLGQFYIAPDNGLLSLIFDRPSTSVVAITNPHNRRSVVSATFHGRDVMAPAAAHLVCGRPLADLGAPLDRSPVRLTGLEPIVSAERIEGTVVRIDRYGNLVTNIRVDLLDGLPLDRLRVAFGHVELVGVNRCYVDAAEGHAIVLLGSSGFLEIAINRGNAAVRFDVREETAVVVDEPV
ncbi:MAG: SAM-dependent chlorinase/fluorinase [Planctomycetaceae bacterium]